jgi:glycosyltransferase involved in cell wall biosynthesis
MRLVLAGWPRERVTPCLHIVGEPANLQSSQLIALAAGQGLVLGKDFRLTDTRVADVPSLLSRAALGLVPSIGSESICRVAAEFLLCGTPIAVSGVGSLEDMLFEGAGLSYRGLKDEDAAKLIQELTLTSLSEGEEAKRRRALRARETCSLAKMGQRLSQILRPFDPGA